MSNYRITVTKIDPAPATTAGHPVPLDIETEVFRQTVENFDLPKFVVALNKKTRVRKSKSQS